MTLSLSDRLRPPLPAVIDSHPIPLLGDNLSPDQRSFLQGVSAGSPYLAELMASHVGYVALCLQAPPENLLDTLLADVTSAWQNPMEQLASHLRQCKARFALLCALCDLGNVWSLDEVTGAITRFADAAINCALNALLREFHDAGKLSLPHPETPSKNCGYTLLAMGKHGAFELNYSSDVDLIALYDAETSTIPADGEVTKTFVRLTQRLVALLQEQTADGYVYRVDLRLRPDPRATQIAISIQSAEQYYLNLGQNWERAAFIKARAMGGDVALGEDFIKTLQPYIWRKYLDFAAIADVQSLIRQIHAVKGHGEIAVEGHNLKLGRGGIREIEFFVQTQQLIAGGRNPALRGRRTVDMLHELAEAQWISAETANTLAAAYTDLRTWEHRTQMQHDAQTHHVPAGDDFAPFAAFCGEPDAQVFRERVRHLLETVRAHSSRLFEQSAALGSDKGALVFTGGEDDPETIETLKRMGFAQASEMSATIRGWHFGRYAATRDKRAREALTELMPKLLEALSRAGAADRCFIDFDAFLRGLPAGVQLFAMLRNTPSLLDLLASIIGTAPRLATALGRRPRILEAVLDPGFFSALPSRPVMVEQAAALVPPGLPLDEAMDRMRVFGRERMFRVGVRVLSETVTAEEAGQGFTHVAEVVIGTLLAAVTEDVTRQHGIVEGGRLAVLAMGKLGGREMTAGSDLDLVVVYDHAESCQQSTGPRALSPAQYYTKLTQRLITAVSAPTAEGELYEVDMRLRPSGSKGPVAVHFPSFKTYQADSAWTWEKLALTRARPVAGDAALSLELEAAKRAALCASRDEAATRTDVVTMRSLMLQEHKPASVWDIKRARGGLVEAEFIAQFLQLVHAPTHASVLDTNTFHAFAKLRDAGVLTGPDAEALLSATRLYHRLTQLLRLCIEDTFDPATALPGLTKAVATAAETPDLKTAENLLQDTQTTVAALFDRLVGDPQKKT